VTDVRRTLPAVGTLLDLPDVRAMCERASRPLVTESIRAVVDRVRQGAPAPDGNAAWTAAIAAEVARRESPSLRPVFNATGVVLHTNLGRAPLAQVAIDAIARTASAATNLEYDLDRGARGSRYAHCTGLLCELTGAEDALVVNNGAAALVLALNTIADGKEAVVSRGELIEIGGSFRVPDIMAKSGATLREVGTTNRTHPDDYRRVFGTRTGAIVKVHRSNFEQRGFVAEATVRELATMAHEAGVPLLMDLGSGLLVSLQEHGLTGEPTVPDVLRDGASLVVMSGDKMLGGPQAGILVGRADLIAACRHNPLTRALRVDKLTLAALEATLALYRDPDRAAREIPVLAMLTMIPEAVRTRAERLAERIGSIGVSATVVAAESTPGGGAFPMTAIPSFAVSLDGDVEAMEQTLRRHDPPVIGRIADGRLLLDLRSIPEALDTAFGDVVVAALSA